MPAPASGPRLRDRRDRQAYAWGLKRKALRSCARETPTDRLGLGEFDSFVGFKLPFGTRGGVTGAAADRGRRGCIARPMSAQGLWNTNARRAFSRIWLSIDPLNRGVREAVTDCGDLALPIDPAPGPIPEVVSRRAAPTDPAAMPLPPVRSNARDHLSDRRNGQKPRRRASCPRSTLERRPASKRRIAGP